MSVNFEKQIKNLDVFNEFKKNLTCGKLSQAYLFVCPDALTNQILLLELAKFLQCDTNTACNKCDNCLKINAGTHPDVLVYPKGQNFMVSDASSIYDNVQVKPMLSKYKIFIINNIDLATEQAQNKMLKLLEEPPLNVVFLMSASNLEKVLSTIQSRVQKMTVDKLKESDLKEVFTSASNDVLQIAICFGDGYIGSTQNILNDTKFIENYKNMKNLIKNMKNSSQIPYFSLYFSKDKNIFETNLKILNMFFRDMLMLSLNKPSLVLNKLEQEEFEMLVSEFSTFAITQILKCLNDAKQKLDSNVNLAILADDLLLKILEIKYICK